MKKFLILFLLFSTKAFCQDFKWLEGKWQEDNNKSFEVWSLKNNALKGTGYKLLQDGSKTINEEMSIQKKQGNYFFISDVAGPQEAIDFKITSHDLNSFIAENPAHDFPKKISYKRMDDNHLQAFISDGDKSIIRFYFTKVNE